MKHLKSLNIYLWKYKWLLGLGILFITLSNLFGVYSPIIIKQAIDEITISATSISHEAVTPISKTFIQSFGLTLLYFAGMMLLLAILRGVFLFLMRQTIIVMSRKIEFDQKKELFDHYQKLDLNFYKMNSTGDMMSRITEDISRVRMYTGPAIMYVINTSVLFVMVVFAMMKVNEELTFFSLLPLPLLAASIFYVNSIIEKKSEAIQAQLSSLTTFSQESFSGIRVIKSYVQEKLFGKRFEAECDDYKLKQLQLARVEAIYFPVIFMLVGLSTLFTIFIGGSQVISGKISAGTIAEFVIYINMLTWPIASVGWITAMMQRAGASQKRLNEFLSIAPSIISSNASQTDLKGEISFQNVHFTFPHSGIKALTDVSFNIRPGQKVLILGKTGSGKTTIGQLILRLYDVNEGNILIDRSNIKDLNLHSLRSQIGYVPQDVFLFSDKVKNNIQFGNKSYNENEIEEASKLAAIYNEINELPEKFDTLIGERGVTLSGGQKQRVSIARAFIKNPKLVVMDDCLSALDANTEKTITDHLKNNLANRTAIIITHRIPQSIIFDQILVLENGKIIEKGNHSLLISTESYYKGIWEKQLKESVEQAID